MNSSSPSFSEMEFTMDLPCTHFKPASITAHLEESIIIGILAISGSEATKFKKWVMAFWASSIPSSILISITWAPFSTCCLATETASSYFSSIMSFAKALDPVTLVRSPTLTNKDWSSISRGSSPDSLVIVARVGIFRGGKLATSSAMALIWAGVVPQQPPAILTKPLSANSFRSDDVSCGFSSNPVSDIGFGRPAFG